MHIPRFIAGLAGLALTFCAGTWLTAAESSRFPATVVVSDAWIRANAPGLDVAAAYFNIRNTGRQPVVLAGISTPAAAGATMHMTILRKGISSMREVASLTIAPGETVKFEPGGMHVMLMGLTGALQPGRGATLRFVLSTGATLQQTAPIKSVAEPVAGP